MAKKTNQQPIVHITPASNRSLGLAEAWEYRSILFFLGWRDVKVRYKQTVLGASWAVLQPLLMMVVFTLVFGRGLRVPTDNLPYPVFVLSGLVLWNLFGNGVLLASNSTVVNAAMLKKVYFPRLFVPISAVGVSVFDFAVALVPLAGVLLYYRTVPSLSLVLSLPIALALITLNTIGLGCFLAALNIKYRDFRYVVPFGIQLGLFVTPVIYPSSALPEGPISALLRLNPLRIPIEILRSSIDPIRPFPLAEVSVSAIMALVVFFGGLAYFKRVEWEFADVA